MALKETKTYTTADIKWMRKALALADKGRGYVSPNPLVGCVIVSSNGRLVGKGYHEHYGLAHAEVNAIESVKDESDLVDATMYVTLEPCAHYGKTPPCADRIAQLPIQRLVVAVQDPNPSVNGKGIKRISSAGIEVDVGLLEDEALRQNEAFFYYTRFHRPFVVLKIAQTIDGYIAAPDGDSRWISGEEARTMVHRWRSECDAVLIGRNTALLDNPRLTVRHVEGRQPYRVVIDGNYSLPDDLNLFSDQFEEKTIVVSHNRRRVDELADPMLRMLKPNYFRGKVILVPEKNGHSDLDIALEKLAEASITSVLVESGSNLATALIRDQLVDKLQIFISPKLLGGGTRSVIGLGLQHMNEILELREYSWEMVGKDMLFTGYL